ncbi:hypothetical protein CFELI_12850 [Corynebacterium felinum]|uniref:Uncharacterized protein n=2 Tax=Corynebacterium felinum TaxID=131318 RepID=A0ABU2B6F7_9CORY|nr:hypothetical protein [Corynebacterium felinum]WJY96149.1 hypothetical protein CFELI_12850 [Corynebacterium felinum]
MASKNRKRGVELDRRMWKMNPDRLQEHLVLKGRARTIPDKRKKANKEACRRGKWQAFGLSSGGVRRVSSPWHRWLCSRCRGR